MARAPLSSLDDYELVDDDQDIRGWSLKDAGGKVLGTVREMIVDTDMEKVVSVVLDNGAEYPTRDLSLGDRVVLLERAAPAAQARPGAQVPQAGMAAGQQGAVRLPVIEEQLRITKRQVERGGVRVTSHIKEQPVQGQVQLREEHVAVERRPVDRPATPADVRLQGERAIEVRETAEVPVVAKQARVVEEVIVRKDVDERTETVRDSVRRTDVDVERVSPTDRRKG